ncbi:hypothetical protein L3Q82_005165 [Scortum barcoo]|uniref:Uncharacterized protein n=1 Tax=Scortum barcoo TaxID=214431 RepID=A0ACB8V9M0_9TELE|nr:hypothetical protein L3Q82_005165 [Scortum barcoo]
MDRALDLRLDSSESTRSLRHDCVATHSSNTIIKFADDTTVIGLNDDERAYREEVRALTSWCQYNNPHLNICTTKKLIVDFMKRQGEEHIPLSINETTVERVHSFRFLTWTHQTDFNTRSNDIPGTLNCWPLITPRVKQWSEEASDALRDCFDTTDWEVLCGPQEQDIDSLTDCITDYINFCVETTVPTKRPEHRPAHLQLPLPARPLTTINTFTISGALTLPPAFTTSLQCSSPPPPPSPNLFTPTVDQVRTQLKKIKARKATGPDGISFRLLRDCADQLCQVVCYIFNLKPESGKSSCPVEDFLCGSSP